MINCYLPHISALEEFEWGHQQPLGEVLRNQLAALQDRIHLNGVQNGSSLLHQLPLANDRKMQLQVQQQLEQQHLLQQLQIQQRHYLMQQGVSANEVQRLWQDSLLDPASSSRHLLAGLGSHDGKHDGGLSHSLYQNGHCVWMGCEASCDTYFAFLHHLASAHPADDRASAQVKIQAQILEQLERQVEQERRRLKAMQALMLTKQSPDTTTPITSTFAAAPDPLAASSPETVSPVLPAATGLLLDGIVTPSTSRPAPRKRLPDKNSLPISADIARNRDFYRNNDVRPPYTYAALIRQAILDHEDKQLTLNEIYNWFQDTFAYFRRNAATWKNAVRHNLSLHKCFMRVENVKGAVWTVDEAEFYRRRPQRLSSSTYRPSMENPLATSRHHSASMSALTLPVHQSLPGQHLPRMINFADRNYSPGPDFSGISEPDEGSEPTIMSNGEQSPPSSKESLVVTAGRETAC